MTVATNASIAVGSRQRSFAKRLNHRASQITYGEAGRMPFRDNERGGCAYVRRRLRQFKHVPIYLRHSLMLAWASALPGGAVIQLGPISDRLTKPPHATIPPA
jgi:hypothetical protein